MSAQKRRRVIAGNWKMYKTQADTRAFFAAFKPLVAGVVDCDILVAPPFTSISAAVEATKATKIAISAQNVFWEEEGAFTGEVSAAMLLETGCRYTIIGHSERRQLFGETDEMVNIKLRAALATGLVSIVCVGEVIEEREAGLTEDVLGRQITRAFAEISGADAQGIAVAYEPVWAIGTGRTATPQLASDAHRFIRSELAKAIGHAAAQGLRILYGGSVKPDNAGDLMAEAEIDGALVGGASLDAKSFAAIVKY